MTRNIPRILRGTLATVLIGLSGINGLYAATVDPEQGNSDTAEETGSRWDAASESSSEAWEKTKEASGNAWDATKETSAHAWDKTKEISSETWEATKEGSARAWNKTKEISIDAWESTSEWLSGTDEDEKDETSPGI